MLLAAAAGIGCETVDRRDPTVPLPSRIEKSELVELTRTSWEACLADFYRDDWEKVEAHVPRLQELADRWAGVARRSGSDELDAISARLNEATTALEPAVTERSVPEVTGVLREVAAEIDSLRRMMLDDDF